MTTTTPLVCRRCGKRIEAAQHPVLGKVYVDLAKPDLHISERARCVQSEFLILHEPKATKSNTG